MYVYIYIYIYIIYINIYIEREAGLPRLAHCEAHLLPHVLVGLQSADCQSGSAVPRQSLGRGRQKSIFPQDNGFQKWRSHPDAVLNEFTPSNKVAW